MKVCLLLSAFKDSSSSKYGHFSQTNLTTFITVILVCSYHACCPKFSGIHAGFACYLLYVLGKYGILTKEILGFHHDVLSLLQ